MTWSYIAGFFDGEGSLVHNGKGYRVIISQTNREVLETIRNFTGFGYVVEVTKRKSHWKDSWIYFISKQEDIYKFLIKSIDFLIVKRQLAEKGIFELKDVIRKQNERKSRRRLRIKETKHLRDQGLTYRQIGKKLGIDFGYARRLILKK